MIAAQRARDIAAGGSLTLDRDNDKNPVVALREIADETVPLDGLRTALVQGLQKHVEVDEPEEEGGFGAGDTDLLGELMAEANEPDEKEAAEAGMSIDGEFEDEPAVAGEAGAEEDCPASPALQPPRARRWQ